MWWGIGLIVGLLLLFWWLDRGIPAIVTAVCLRGNVSTHAITYECAWLHDGQRRTGWFTPAEVEPPEKSEPMVIGFNQPSTNGKVGAKQ